MYMVQFTSSTLQSERRLICQPFTSDGYKVVCYFTNWAWYRQGEGKYLPEDIAVELCTHIVYGFAVLNNNNLLIKPHDTWADIDNSKSCHNHLHKRNCKEALVY